MYKRYAPGTGNTRVRAPLLRMRRVPHALPVADRGGRRPPRRRDADGQQLRPLDVARAQPRQLAAQPERLGGGAAAGAPEDAGDAGGGSLHFPVILTLILTLIIIMVMILALAPYSDPLPLPLPLPDPDPDLDPDPALDPDPHPDPHPNVHCSFPRRRAARAAGPPPANGTRPLCFVTCGHRTASRRSPADRARQTGRAVRQAGRRAGRPA